MRRNRRSRSDRGLRAQSPVVLAVAALFAVACVIGVLSVGVVFLLALGSPLVASSFVGAIVAVVVIVIAWTGVARRLR